MATVAITNIGLAAFMHELFGLQPADGVTRTYTLKNNQNDNTRGNYDGLSKLGIILAENGTARPGSVVVTTTAAIAAGVNAVIVDATTLDYTLTLPALAAVPVGHSVFFYLRTNTSATITIDGNASETVLGAANQTLTTAGQSLRIKKESATNWKLYRV